MDAKIRKQFQIIAEQLNEDLCDVKCSLEDCLDGLEIVQTVLTDLKDGIRDDIRRQNAEMTHAD